MKVDIGGGTAPLAGYVNLDPVHGTGAWKREAQDVSWPVCSDRCEAIHASHVLEHIPAGEPRLTVFNEAWRVLRVGGTFTVIVPLFPSWQAIADPTHLSLWVPESFAYFTPAEQGAWAPQADYGIKPWTTLRFTVRDGWEGTWVGLKPL